MPRKQYETVSTKQALNRVREPMMPFDWSLNPYRGCAHGCSFCYARAFQSHLGLDAGDEFQNRIRIKTNAPEALEQQLAREARRCGGDLDQLAERIGVVAVGTATDPYQPVEAKASITRDCLRVLARYGIPATITTRSPLILRDLELLAGMRSVTVNISINTLRADLTRRMEPASPFPMKRLKVMEQLNARGIVAGMFMAPILPCLTDSSKDLEALISAAKDHGARFAAASLLRLTPDVKPWFLRTLENHYPHLSEAYRSLYPSVYAKSAYAGNLLEKVERLLAKYGLTSGLPLLPKASGLSGTGDGRSCPLSAPAAVPASPAYEQLAFPF